jgi:hypothetical protein
MGDRRQCHTGLSRLGSAGVLIGWQALVDGVREPVPEASDRPSAVQLLEGARPDGGRAHPGLATTWLPVGGRDESLGQQRWAGHMGAVATGQLDHPGTQPGGGDPPGPGRLDDPVAGAHDRGAGDRREPGQGGSVGCTGPRDTRGSGWRWPSRRSPRRSRGTGTVAAWWSRNGSTPTQAGLSGHSACSDCAGRNPRVRLTGAKGALESPG